MKYFLLAFCWLGAMSAAAAVIDLRVAPGVPMAETDLLAVLEVRVKEAADAGLFTEKDREAKSRFDRLARRPVALGLAKADAPRTWGAYCWRPRDSPWPPWNSFPKPGV